MNDDIINNLNERLDKTIERGRDILADEEFQRQVDEMKEMAEDTIRKHPLTSVAAGVVVGFLLARMFRSGD